MYDHKRFDELLLLMYLPTCACKQIFLSFSPGLALFVLCLVGSAVTDPRAVVRRVSFVPLFGCLGQVCVCVYDHKRSVELLLLMYLPTSACKHLSLSLRSAIMKVLEALLLIFLVRAASAADPAILEQKFDPFRSGIIPIGYLLAKKAN